MRYFIIHAHRLMDPQPRLAPATPQPPIPRAEEATQRMRRFLYGLGPPAAAASGQQGPHHPAWNWAFTALGSYSGRLHPFEVAHPRRLALGQILLEGVVDHPRLAVAHVQIAEAELLQRFADRLAQAEVGVEHRHHPRLVRPGLAVHQGG